MSDRQRQVSRVLDSLHPTLSAKVLMLQFKSTLWWKYETSFRKRRASMKKKESNGPNQVLLPLVLSFWSMLEYDVTTIVMLAFFHPSSDYLCLLMSFLFLIRTGVDYDAGFLVTNGKLCILAVSQFGYSLSWYVLDLLIIEVIYQNGCAQLAWTLITTFYTVVQHKLYYLNNEQYSGFGWSSGLTWGLQSVD